MKNIAIVSDLLNTKIDPIELGLCALIFCAMVPAVYCTRLIIAVLA